MTKLEIEQLIDKLIVDKGLWAYIRASRKYVEIEKEILIDFINNLLSEQKKATLKELKSTGGLKYIIDNDEIKYV